ncbi:MAG: hypothetical protein LBV60_03840 [Streptomyces sp.]|jgi:hypothetical protein|nr:hypothetical protein [Streptomyces sp.]
MPEWPGIAAVAERRGEGTELSVAEYRASFRAEYPKADLVDKLEFAQYFAEPGYAPWEAAHQGDWSEALRLAEAERPVLRRQYEDAAARGARLRRVRMVELPPSPYVLWEMSVLRLRAELGEEIKVLPRTVAAGPARNQRHPPPAHMPELVVLGALALYELRYTPDGAADGAVRHDDAALISAVRRDLEQFLATGEELLSFHARVTEPLLHDLARNPGGPAL